MTTGVETMNAAYPSNAPYRLYAVQYYGPDGPNCNCESRPEGCMQGGNVQHPCQTQSQVNEWECNFNYPHNDGVSQNPGAAAVYGTGYPDCQTTSASPTSTLPWLAASTPATTRATSGTDRP